MLLGVVVSDNLAPARGFEKSRRRDLVTFNHHREVASLPQAEADQVLDWDAILHYSLKALPRSLLLGDAVNRNA